MYRDNFYKLYNDTKEIDNIVDEFHKLYYYTACINGTWRNTKWMGIPIFKNPMDMIVYQELIYKIRPDIIIETGTKMGGSALFFANICDNIKHGQVITVDINKINNLRLHDRITYLNGNSVDTIIVDFIKQRCENKKVMVILDSDHAKDHVLKELNIYSEIVSIGSYLIVEDTNISNSPVCGIGTVGEGPLEAVLEFMGNKHGYTIDRSMEKFYFTFNPMGWLKRIK